MSSVTKKIAEYISGQNFSVDEISKELDIEVQKLQVGTEEALEADEFLSLCFYLKIKPEQFYAEIEL